MGKLTYQSGYKPVTFPFTGNVGKAEIDRCQSFDASVTLPNDEIRQLGSDGVSAYIAGIQDASLAVKQWEYGKIEFFQKLANVDASAVTLTLSDFDSAACDYVSYLTNTAGTFYGSLVLPNMRLSGFSINVSDSKALVERNFTMVGENSYLFQGANKYYIEKIETVGSGELVGDDFSVVLSDPTPVVDPDNSGYIFKVIRVRSGVSTELTTSDYSYVSGTATLTVSNAALADVYKIYYTAGSYITAQNPFVENVSDAYGVRASFCELYIGTTNRLQKVTSASIDVTLTRDDVIGIGYTKAEERGITERAVKISLGQMMDSDLTVEEFLRGESSGYGKIDYDKLSTDITFVMAIYDNADHDNLLIGYKATGLSVSDLKPGSGNIKANASQNFNLKGSDLTITTSLAELGI